MKKISLLLLFATMLNSAKAFVFVVNNNANSPSIYTTPAAAIGVANAGDTIYLAGSTTTYGNLTITKSVTIIGTGANPQKQFPYTSSLGIVGMSGSLANVKVKGVVITGTFSLGSGTSNFDLEQCYFTLDHLKLNTNCTNIRISNCIFLNHSSFQTHYRNIDGFDPCASYYAGCTNLLIQNCIFNGTVSGLNIPGTVIQNNIFLYNGDAFDGFNILNNGGCFTPSYIYNVTIANNIFYRANPTNYTSGCAFSNNISYNPSGTFGLMGASNFDNVNPLFTTFPAAGDYFSYVYSFHLTAASPGYNAGSDGKDIGIYGGTFPAFISGEVYGMPVIRQMNISNTNVEPNGNLNVKVQSTNAK